MDPIKIGSFLRELRKEKNLLWTESKSKHIVKEEVVKNIWAYEVFGLL